MVAKNSLPIILTVMFTIAIINPALFPKATSSSETVVKVEPEWTELGNSNGDPIPPGTQFNVTIKIYNVTNLYGFDLKFKWNTTYLEYVNHFIHIPKDIYPDGILWSSIILFADEVNTTEGTYWIACSSLNPAPSFNGSGAVFTMTFEVKKQPYDYETGGTGYVEVILNFSSTDLAAFGGESIQHDRSHATIRIWGKRSELASTISIINPLTQDTNFKFYTNTTSIGSRFNITIHVYNAADLQAYQIRLEYNSTFLNATRAWLPTWDKEWVFYGKTTTRPQPIFGFNYVLVSASIQGNYPTFSGNGILCIIELEIIYAPTTGEISCNLNINNKDTLLLNSDPSEISAIKINGYYVYTFAKLNSFIILNVSPEKITLGSSVIISGTLIPAKPNVNITIEYQLERQNDWALIIIKLTDNDGNFTYMWTPPKAGNYTIRASWPGDQNTNPSKSEVKIEVEARSTGQEPFYIVGAAAVIIIVVLGVYFTRIRKRK